MNAPCNKLGLPLDMAPVQSSRGTLARLTATGTSDANHDDERIQSLKVRREIDKLLAPPAIGPLWTVTEDDQRDGAPYLRLAGLHASGAPR